MSSRREGTEAVPTEREVLKWIAAAGREIAVAAEGLRLVREEPARIRARTALLAGFRALDDAREALDFVRGRAVAAGG